jgi:hypothetical protein
VRGDIPLCGREPLLWGVSPRRVGELLSQLSLRLYGCSQLVSQSVWYVAENKIFSIDIGFLVCKMSI